MHDAFLGDAMKEPEDMPQLVKNFFQKPGLEEVRVRSQAISLRSKAVIRDNRYPTVDFRLAENVGQDWNIEIERDDGNGSRVVVLPGAGISLSEMKKNLRGIVLASLGVVELLGVEVDLAQESGTMNLLLHRRDNTLKEFEPCTSQREDMDRCHCSRFSPYFSIL